MDVVLFRSSEIEIRTSLIVHISEVGNEIHTLRVSILLFVVFVELLTILRNVSISRMTDVVFFLFFCIVAKKTSTKSKNTSVEVENRVIL